MLFKNENDQKLKKHVLYYKKFDKNLKKKKINIDNEP